MLHLFFILVFHTKASEINPWSGCPNDPQTRSECPTGWVKFDTNCYAFISHPFATFTAANADCLSRGALMLRIETMEEHLFVSDWLKKNVLNRSVRWYTSGSMLTSPFGEFIWSGWPPDKQTIRPSLYELWFDTPPTASDMPTWPANRDKLVYGINGVSWGWYIDTSTEARPYVCQAPTLNAKYLRPNGRTIDYGQNDTQPISRGPCFVEQPSDAWYVSGIDVDNFVQFKCIANGNPTPNYRWYRLSLVGGSSGLMHRRTLIDPLNSTTGRIAISGGNLVIHYPSSSLDSENYQCEAYNIYGSILSQTAK
ncbi:unnamed protein product, partial [Hymenolepis diminuta]